MPAFEIEIPAEELLPRNEGVKHCIGFTHINRIKPLVQVSSTYLLFVAVAMRITSPIKKFMMQL